jgi:hypothetical protein
MEPSPNPFAVLSLIVAPAILTNACSVLVMSTSNRLARAADRARELSKQLEKESDAPEADRRLAELASNERRVLLLVRGLRSFYTALGGFASATLISLLGAVVVSAGLQSVAIVFEVAGVAAGLVAVGAIVHGSLVLLQEIRIVVQLLTQRADKIREQAAR